MKNNVAEPYFDSAMGLKKIPDGAEVIVGDMSLPAEMQPFAEQKFLEKLDKLIVEHRGSLISSLKNSGLIQHLKPAEIAKIFAGFADDDEVFDIDIRDTIKPRFEEVISRQTHN